MFVCSFVCSVGRNAGHNGLITFPMLSCRPDQTRPNDQDDQDDQVNQDDQDDQDDQNDQNDQDDQDGQDDQDDQDVYILNVVKQTRPDQTK